MAADRWSINVYTHVGSRRVTWRCLRIALKLRATRPPAQECWTTVRARQGTNTPVPLRRSPPGSFKRLLGRGPTTVRTIESPAPRPARGPNDLAKQNRAHAPALGYRLRA